MIKLHTLFQFYFCFICLSDSLAVYNIDNWLLQMPSDTQIHYQYLVLRSMAH